MVQPLKSDLNMLKLNFCSAINVNYQKVYPLSLASKEVLLN